MAIISSVPKQVRTFSRIEASVFECLCVHRHQKPPRYSCCPSVAGIAISANLIKNTLITIQMAAIGYRIVACLLLVAVSGVHAKCPFFSGSTATPPVSTQAFTSSRRTLKEFDAEAVEKLDWSALQVCGSADSTDS